MCFCSERKARCTYGCVRCVKEVKVHCSAKTTGELKGRGIVPFHVKGKAELWYRLKDLLVGVVLGEAPQHGWILMFRCWTCHLYNQVKCSVWIFLYSAVHGLATTSRQLPCCRRLCCGSALGCPRICPPSSFLSLSRHFFCLV